MSKKELQKAIAAKIESNPNTISILSAVSTVPEIVITKFVNTGEIDDISLMKLDVMK